MAIDGPGPLNAVEGSRVLGAPATASRPTPAAADDVAETRFAPTEELARWLASVRQTAAVRQEVVGEVARRLAAGELATRAAADRVVQEILGSNVLNDF